MEQWTKLSQAIYYTGVGTVLLGTGLRFLARYFSREDEETKFIKELQETHLSNIYAALQQIATELKIQLRLKIPGVRSL